MQSRNQQTLALAELNTRAREIFRQIVDAYLVSGAPVGSRTLSKGGLGLSPASIRNVMQDLEELGLLAAPHTSAGRLPTELGLRMFVDGMMQAAEPSQDERAALEAGLAPGVAMEEALTRTTAALSGLSQCAGLVLVPAGELEAAAAQEYSQLLAQARQKRALAPDDHPQVIRLRSIAQRLIPPAPRWNDRARQWTWEVHLIASRQINAFCMPGGKIAFFHGFISACRST